MERKEILQINAIHMYKHLDLCCYYILKSTVYMRFSLVNDTKGLNIVELIITQYLK